MMMKLTFNMPISNSIDIKIVIAKLINTMIFTIHFGNSSMMIVRRSTLTVAMMMIPIIASIIAATPATILPVRSEEQQQNVFNTGIFSDSGVLKV